MLFVIKTRSGIEYREAYVNPIQLKRIKRFKRFLANSKVYESYLANTYKQDRHPFVRLLECEESSDFVTHAFRWASTDEGRTYWCVLHYIWNVVFCKKNADTVRLYCTTSKEEDKVLAAKLNEFREKGYNMSIR